jgi:predicted lysophospholipase L1 biosynthesis ABC-type transport system permease subunit
VNQTLAKQYFPGEDPIGKQILYEVSSKPPMQIVGVVDDIKEGSLDAAARPALYVPFNQGPSRFFSLAVRTSQDEKSVFRSLATAIHEVEPGAIIYGESTMADRINRSPEAHLHRCSAWLTGGFAAIAFVLEIVGLYGVVAYSAGRRTREIGIRMALGASPASVHRLILREATWLAIAGIAIGAVCSVIAAALIRRLLFGVQPWDAATLCAVMATLAVSAVLAAYIPAHRAASVSPVEALRAE